MKGVGLLEFGSGSIPADKTGLIGRGETVAGKLILKIFESAAP